MMLAVFVRKQIIVIKSQNLKINIIIITIIIQWQNQTLIIPYEALIVKLQSIENELKEKKKLDLSYFIGKSNFMEDGTQNYLVFHPINKYFKLTVITGYLSS